MQTDPVVLDDQVAAPVGRTGNRDGLALAQLLPDGGRRRVLGEVHLHEARLGVAELGVARDGVRPRWGDWRGAFLGKKYK